MLLHLLAEWLMAHRAYAPAEELLRSALHLVQDEPLEVRQGGELAQSRVLIRLAECQKERQDHAAARVSAEQARALVQAAPQHPIDVANAENCLGVILAAQQEHAAAERHLLRAAMLFRGPQGTEEGYAGSQANLGQVLAHQNKREEADRAFCRALLSFESLGIADGRRANAHYYLAQVLFDLGRKQAARSHFERCLALHEKLAAQEHPHVGATLLYLGVLASERGDLVQARHLAERAMPILVAGGQMEPDVFRLWRKLQGEESAADRSAAPAG